MPLTIPAELESKLRARADAAGITVEAYIERMASDDQSAEDELEKLALEGVNSGEPINPDPQYWAGKHRSLDERLRNAGAR